MSFLLLVLLNLAHIIHPSTSLVIAFKAYIYYSIFIFFFCKTSFMLKKTTTTGISTQNNDHAIIL